MNIFKRIMALVLAVLMFVGTMPLQALAAEPGNIDSSLETGDVTVEGTNSFGNLVSSVIEQEQDEAKAAYEAGYAVTDIVVEGNSVTVRYNSLEEANLVVGIYSEDGLRLHNSAKAVVSPDENEVAISISGEMPEYFLVSAYMLDMYDYSPLCASYESPMYTQDMQELLAMSVEDAKTEYGEDRVYNMDESEDTNFAVYADSTIVIHEEPDVNTVVSSDDENLVYKFSNIDERIAGLQEDDVVVYILESGELIIFKVASVTIAETSATITGAEMELGDAFSLMKLENEGETADMEILDNEIHPDLHFEAVYEDVTPYGIRPAAIEGEASKKVSLKYTYEKFNLAGGDEDDEGIETPLGTISGKADLTMDFTISLSVKVNIFLTLERQFVELRIENIYTLSLALEGKISIEGLKFKGIQWTPIPGVTIKFEPSLFAELSGEYKVSISGEIKIGFGAELRAGEQIQFYDLSEEPTVDFGLEMEGKLFFGLQLNPKLEAVSGHLLEAGLKGRIGIEISAKEEYKMSDINDLKNASAPMIHECLICVDGEISLAGNLTAEVKFLNNPKWELSKDLLTVKVKLGDFYYSLDHADGGFGECPYRLFRVIIKVMDDQMSPAKGVEVKLSNNKILGKSNENGVVELVYLSSGVYTFMAKIGGVHEQYSEEIRTHKTVILTTNKEYKERREKLKLLMILPDNISAKAKIDSGKCGDSAYWTLYENGIFEITGTGAIDSVTWSKYKDQIKNVRIGDGITEIVDRAFANYTNIEKLIIEDCVKEIGSYAFQSCTGIKQLKVPVDVIGLTGNSFDKCSNIETIQFTYGSNGIMPNYSLTTITYAPMYASRSKLTAVLMDEGITNVGNYAFYDCSALTTVNIPSTVTGIGENAFAGCAMLGYIDLPDGLTSLGRVAFGGCENLSEINIPDGIVSIPEHCFTGCTSLTRLELHNGIESIGGGAFGNCTGITYLKMPVDAKISGANVFETCPNIEKIHFTYGRTGVMTNYSLSNIQYSPLHGSRSKLTTVLMDEGITNVGNYAFYDCSALTTVNIPSTVTGIGENAFAGCAMLDNIELPDGLISLGRVAFGGCVNLSEINIPDGIVSIPEHCFTGCTSLTRLELHNGIESIGAGAFGNCTGITYLKMPVDAKISGANVFETCTNIEKIHFTYGSTGVMPNYSLSNIQYSPLHGSRSKLTTVLMDEGITEVGNYAFYECSALTTVNIPSTVTSIGQNAFSRCILLENIELPDGLTSLGRSAFGGCVELSEIILPENIASISDYCFSGCTNLAECKFTGNAPDISTNAFSGCTLTAYYPENDESWAQTIQKTYSGTVTWVPYDPGADVPENESETEVVDEPAVVKNEVLEKSSVAVTALPKIKDEEPGISPNAVYDGEYDSELSGEFYLHTANFSGLVPGQEYVLLALYSLEADDLLAPDNVLYIDQMPADGDGNIQFRYASDYTDYFNVIACGASHRDLKDAVITFPELVSNGSAMLVQPTVVYDGETLIENVDYTIVDGNLAIEPGEYVCRIRGICNYTGLVDVPYTLEADPDHVDSGTCGEDLVWELDTSGTLTITGSGSMEETPWEEHSDSVQTVIIGSDVEYLEEDAFDGCENLTDIYFDGTEDDWNALHVVTGEGVCVHYQVEDIANHWTTETSDPTCTEPGYRYDTCSCGNERNRIETESALDHQFTNYVSDENTTCTEDGTLTAKCDRCEARDTVPDVGSATGHSYGEWTAEGDREIRICSGCGDTEEREVQKVDSPFTDVPKGVFYYDPVLWAVELGITNGATATTFDPNGACLRAHVVTFLHRAAGKPEPESTRNPFDDVKDGDFFYKPVLWAVENGITNGTGATEFGSYVNCNRAQVVTFLWRAAGSPEPASADNPFADVDSSSFFYKAVLWAVEKGITNGISATEFGPNQNCNRAQVVTFLYRVYNN